MTICKECGVELDVDMRICPLCETSVENGGLKNITASSKKRAPLAIKKKNLLRQILWQITAVLLLSGIVATLIINLSIQQTITWSIYPVTLCLITFSYASVMALWHTKMVYQIFSGWVISTMVLVAIEWFMDVNWPLKIGLPILCAVNLVGLLLNFILVHLKVKGVNIVAIIVVAITVLCLIIEGILSFYFKGVVRFQWSAIVAACLLPVTAAILFMHFKTRDNSDFQKVFHT